jgi:AraC family transcriptional regulator
MANANGCRCGAVELEWQAPQHLVVVTERGGSSRTEVKIGGETRYAGRDRPGSLSFIPAGAQRTCLYERADLAYTALWIDPCLALDLPAGSTFRFR